MSNVQLTSLLSINTGIISMHESYHLLFRSPTQVRSAASGKQLLYLEPSTEKQNHNQMLGVMSMLQQG